MRLQTAESQRCKLKKEATSKAKWVFCMLTSISSVANAKEKQNNSSYDTDTV